MELIELNLCRLCAKTKFPDEIVGQIDNEASDIETKLIACCQWNTFNEIDSKKLPQNVCNDCFQSLQQCWEFSEQIRCAQFELMSKLLNEVEIEMKTDATQNEFLNESAKSDEFPENSGSDAEFAASSDEQHSDHIDFDVTDYQDNTTKLQEACIIEPNEVEVSENIVVDERDEKCNKSISFNERNFLEVISLEDRNNDGTVKPDAIQRLGLENWTIVQYRCYLCQTRLSDRYEWRNHMKLEHPGHRMKHLCNICNVKDYTVRKPLLRHIMNQHRRYFKHW